MLNGTSIEPMLTAGASLLSTVIATKFQLPISMFATLNIFLSGCFDLLWTNIKNIENLKIANVPVDIFVTASIFILLVYAMFWYIIPYLKVWMRHLGITNNYYLCKLRSYINQLLGIYCYVTGSVPDMSLVINDWLVRHKMFIETYPKLYMMRDIQEKIPYDHRNPLWNTIRIPSFNRRYYFNDPILSVCGYIWFEFYYVETHSQVDEASYTNQNTIAKIIKKDVILNIPSAKMHMVVNKDPTVYMGDISKELSETMEYYEPIEGHVTASYSEETGWSTNCNNRPSGLSYKYKGYRNDYIKEHYLEEWERSYIDTFFHPLKQQIWNAIKLSTFNSKEMTNKGFSNSFLACLYGPPGTGKSGFPVKIAMATGKNIKMLDKSLFSSKTALRKFFNDGDYRNSIIVLDEFDHVINELAEAEDRLALNESSKQDIITSLVNQDPDSKLELESELDSEPDAESKKSKKKSKYMTPRMLKTLSMLSEDSKNEDAVTIGDLLDIIQGPSFDKGLTIFATTNNYEAIRERCPRLFRDGRFKPIYFGYPNHDTMNEISQYYYSCDITEQIPELINAPPKIPPCRIINHIKTLIASYPDDKVTQYQEFVKKLRYDFDNYKLSECFTKYEKCIDTESA